VALLVLAHRAPGGLEQLARVFATGGFRIHVHLDRKIDPQAYTAGRTWPDNLRFIEERHEIFWGGFNMVRATVALARDALRHPRTTACVLVSDDTLPLLAPARIHAEISARPDRIDVGLAKRNPPFLRRYTDWFFMDSPATSARPLAIEDRGIDAATLDALQRLARAQLRGKHPLPEVWSGSQWWSLGRPMLEGILDELARDDWLRESFEFAAVPDELAFQTLYANRLGLTARSFTGPMLTDMTRQPAPFVFQAFEELPAIPPGKFFVRKVADTAATECMRRLAASWEAA
jgi:hypothetical protein